MSIIEPVLGDDYPTLPFMVQQSGYTVTNSNDFSFTEYNGAPGRVNAAFLNGWKTAQLQIVFKSEYEQSYWHEFYNLDFNGKSGGLGGGVSPFFANVALGGTFGKFLCQLVNSEWTTSNYRGLTSVLNLTVQVSPDSFNSDAACKKEVISSFIKCGVSPENVKDTISGIKDITNEGMNPINFFYVETAPILKVSPTSSTEAVGIEHELKSEFKGNNLTYQWYKNGSPISNSNSKQYDINPTASDNGSTFYCVASNPLGSAQTETATLSLRPRIYFNTGNWSAFDSSDTVKIKFKSDGFIDVITSEQTLSNFDNWVSPVNDPNLPAFNLSDYKTRVSRLSGDLAIEPGSIGSSFETLSNGDYIEINVAGLTIDQSSFFDIEFQDSQLPNYNWAGWDSGNVFVRRIEAQEKAPFFTKHPESRSVPANQPATFSAEASGTEPISLQWEVLPAGGQYWSDWGGHTSENLTFTPIPGNNGMKIRCRAENNLGTTISNIATITVT